MRFLLIAPERRDLSDSSGLSRECMAQRDREGGDSLDLVYRHLEQDFESRFVTREEAQGQDASGLPIGDVRIKRLRRYESMSNVVWALLIETAFDTSALDGSTGRLEDELSAIASEILARSGCRPLLWVSRTLVQTSEPLAHNEERFHNWLDRSHERGRPPAPAFVVEDGTFTVGWGNNLLRGRNPDALLELAEASLVLAQIVWSHVHALSEAAGDALFAGLELARTGAGASERNFADGVERLTEELVIQNMLADEFMHNNQGASLSTQILDTWGFRTFQASTGRRIEDLRGMASDLRARQQNRYQRTVEWILIAIGMVALLDVAVGAVQLAFAGGVTAVPGSGSSSSLLRAIRAFGADGALLFSATSVMALLAGVLAVMRKLRSERR